jgi:hypothetical protein
MRSRLRSTSRTPARSAPARRSPTRPPAETPAANRPPEGCPAQQPDRTPDRAQADRRPDRRRPRRCHARDSRRDLRTGQLGHMDSEPPLGPAAGDLPQPRVSHEAQGRPAHRTRAIPSRRANELSTASESPEWSESPTGPCERAVGPTSSTVGYRPRPNSTHSSSTTSCRQPSSTARPCCARMATSE